MMHINRRSTQMDADEESRQSPKKRGSNGYSAGSGLDQLFRSVFICVHLRPSAVKLFLIAWLRLKRGQTI
jgi:hypothetical protein